MNGQTETTALIAAAVAAIPSLGMWLWNWVQRRDNRDDKRAEQRDRRDASLYERLLGQTDRAEKRLAEMEAELRRLEEERDRGWALAWAWFNRAQELRHTMVVLLWDVRDRESGTPLRDSIPTLPAFRDILNGKDKA